MTRREEGGERGKELKRKEERKGREKGEERAEEGVVRKKKVWRLSPLTHQLISFSSKRCFCFLLEGRRQFWDKKEVSLFWDRRGTVGR